MGILVRVEFLGDEQLEEARSCASPIKKLLVLLVSDSEYNNFTGQKPIQCHCGTYFVLPLARAAARPA
jgi:hypothetical protein